MQGSPIKIFCSDNGIFPNSHYPALLYKDILKLRLLFSGSFVANLFDRNGWSNSWRNGIFTFHHYHSITHEVMGFYGGHTRLMLGGDNGHKIEVSKGDVLIIPAGMAHKNIGEENQVQCVGAYPEGRNFDMNYGRMYERPGTDRNIARVQVPGKHPVFGTVPELRALWSTIPEDSIP